MDHRSALIAARRLAAAMACVGAAAAAGLDPTVVVARATLKVRATRRMLPNFTCVETVTRVFFRPASTLNRPCAEILRDRQHPTLDLVLRPWSTDRLRLDVTLTERGEIFSWAGARRFEEDADIGRVVRNGPISTGAFGGFLIGVFDQDPAKFQFIRSFTADGRTLLEYAYRIPAAGSNYKLRLPLTPDSWYYTAYSGTFQVDAATDDVVRLEVDTDELPRSVGSCTTLSAMDYNPVRIGRSEVMLTSKMRQRWVNPNGDEAENTTVFSSCREYTGESTVTFFPEGGADSPGSAARAPATAQPVPAGLRLAFALTAPIDADTAAAGDPFRARLTEDLRDSRHKLLAAKGAIVEGRLIAAECFFQPPGAVLVFRPDRVEAGASMAPVAAVRDWGRELAQARGRGRGRVSIDLPPPGSPDSGAFGFTGEHVVVPAGFRSRWRTVRAAGK